jgi:hypothetical protein
LGALEAATASLYTATSSFSGRVGALEAATASLFSYTSSNDAKIASIYTTTSSLNASVAALNAQSASLLSFTASTVLTDVTQSARLSGLEAASASINSYTSSNDAKITSIYSTTSSLNASIASLNSYTASNTLTDATQSVRLSALEAATASLYSTTSSLLSNVAGLYAFSASILSYTSSASTRLSALEAATASLYTATSSFSARVGGLEAQSASLLSYTSSNDAKIASIYTTTSSLNTAVGSLNNATASLNNFSSSHNTATASLNAAVSSLNNATSSIQTFTSSASTRLSALEAATASIYSATSSFSGRVGALESATSSLFNFSSSHNAATASLYNFSSSVNTYTSSLNAKTASFATTGSNTFTGKQYISDATTATNFTSTASIYTDGGLRVTKDAYVSGTLYLNNLTVFGTQSISYISSSQLNIATNIITVNTTSPAVRFGGLAVQDSGSLGTGLTGSMLWDSQNNNWIYSNPSGSGNYDSAMVMMGPQNSSGLGNEVGVSFNAIPKGAGGHHMTSSGIFESGSNVGIGTSSPLGKFHIAATTGITTPGSIALAIRDSGNSGYGFDFNLEGVATGDLSLMRTEASSQAQVMTFKRSNGNVGIGTISPGSSLHVAGDITTSPSGSGIHLGYASNFYGVIQSNGVSGSVIDFASTGVDYKGRLLYDNTNNYLDIYTNATFAMRINSSGNVGIGTSNPTQPLHVNGFARTQGISVYETGGTISGFIGYENDWIGSGTSNDLAIASEGSNNLKFYTNGTTAVRLFVSASGVVGIGTTTAPSLLTIKASATDGNQIYIVQSNDNRGWKFRAKTDGHFYLQSSYNGADTDAIKINYDDGNVGIGTTSPSYKLDVSGSGRFAASGVLPLQVSGNSESFRMINDGAYISWYNTANSTRNGYIQGSTGLMNIQVASGGDINFGNGTDLVRITSGGNVGIGTTSVTQGKLVIAAPDESTISALAIRQSNSMTYGFDFALDQTVNGQAYIYSVNNGTKNSVLEIDRQPSSPNLQLVNSGGNVGIGTTPSYHLDVKSDTSSATLRVGSWTIMESVTTNQSMFGHNVAYATSAGADWRYINTGYAMAIRMHDAFGTGDMMFHLAASSGSLAPLASTWDTTAIKMIIKNDGNIGIGTTAPGAKLHVNGNVSIGTSLSAWNLGNTLQIGGNLSTINFSGTTAILGIVNAYYNGSSYIVQNTGTQASFEYGVAVGDAFNWRMGASANATTTTPLGVVMTLTNGGNLGIGTTSPSNLLDVNGSGNIRGTLNVIANEPQIYLTKTGTDAGSWRILGSTGGTNRRFRIYDDTAGVDRLNIFSTNGNVGIGTTTDSGYKLDVSGDGRFTGTLNANSNITFAGYIKPSSNVGYGVKSSNGTVLQEWYDGSIYNYGLVLVSGTHFRTSGAYTGNQYYNSSAATNEKAWMIQPSGDHKNFLIGTMDDAFSGMVQQAMNILRSGTSISNVSFPNGNVGIGTTSPEGKLHVYASAVRNMLGVSTMALPTSGDEEGVFVVKTNSALWQQSIVGYAVDSKGLRVYNTGGSSYTSFEVVQGDGSKLIVAGSGNVGINTTSPGAKLDVWGNVNTSGSINLRGSYFNTVESSVITIPSDQGLVAYYGFDEGSGTNIIDKTGRNNTTSANLTYTTTAIRGTALNGFGSDSNNVVVPNSSDFDFGTGDFAISLWCYPNSSFTNTLETLVEMGRYTAGILIRPHSNTIEVYAQGALITNPGYVLSIDTWHHIVVTRVSSTLSVFANGTRLIAVSNSSDIQVSDAGYIGRSAHTSGQVFHGIIDEVKFYKNRGLNYGEVRGQYLSRGTTDLIAPISSNTSGNVGIGTYDPTARLHVKGPNAKIRLTGDTYTAVEIEDGGTGDPGYIRTYTYGTANMQLGDGGTYFNVGNIGIGTTSANYHLDVFPGTSSATIKLGSWAVMENVTTDQAMFARNVAYSTSAGSGWRNLNTAGATAIRMYDDPGDASIAFHLHGSETGGTSLASTWDSTDIKMTIRNGGNVGIGTTGPAYKLDVSGTIRATGDVIAYSDARVKDNVETVKDALQTITSLRGVTYTRNDSEDKSRKVGVIAQEVLPILPEVVQQDTNGNYSVAYGNIVGVLIEAIKEQQQQIDELKYLLQTINK